LILLIVLKFPDNPAYLTLDALDWTCNERRGFGLTEHLASKSPMNIAGSSAIGDGVPRWKHGL
jgi:hypothetical protein